MLRLGLAPIDIDHIAQRLEGIEGNAHRQQHIQPGDPDGLVNPLQQSGGEIVVFENKQNAQGDEEGDADIAFLLFGVICFFQQQGAAVADQGGGADEDHIRRVPAHVKVIAGKEQQGPAELMRQHPVKNENNRQENRVGQ